MTYVIANLEDHGVVVSPKLLRLDESLIEGLFRALPSNSLDNLNSGKLCSTFSILLIVPVQTLLMETRL